MASNTLSELMAGLFANEGGGKQAGMAVNNPFDLMPGGKLASYPTMQAGYDAGVRQILAAASGESPYYSPSESLASAVKTFTGNGANAAKNVAAVSGLDMSQPLNSILPSSSGDKNNYMYGGGSDSLSLGTVAGSAPKTAPKTGSGSKGTPSGPSSSGTGLSIDWSSRLVFGVIGLICILAGVFMLALSGVESAIGFASKQSNRVSDAAGKAKAITATASKAAALLG